MIKLLVTVKIHYLCILFNTKDVSYYSRDLYTEVSKLVRCFQLQNLHCFHFSF